MVVKKFEARSMKEALEMIKSELGPEAIIIAARDNSKKYGLVGDGSVEITAAIQEASLQKKNFAESKIPAELRERIHRGSSKTHKELIEKVIRSQELEQKKSRQATHTASTQTPRSTPVRTQRYIDMQDDVEPDAAPNGANERLKIAAQKAWKSIQQSNPSKDRTSTRQHGAVDKLSSQNMFIAQSMMSPQSDWIKDNMEDLKQLFSSFKDIPQNIVSGHPGFEHGIRYELSPYFEKLLQTGIERNLLIQILKHVQEHLPKPSSTHSGDNSSRIQPSLLQGMIVKALTKYILIKNNASDSKIEVFIGAGGHGKTSSLIKRAAALSIQEQKRVAILSTDTKKLGANEQLKIYSQILNIPFMTIESVHDWQMFAPEFHRFDHILVDTAGVRFRLDNEIQDLKKVLPPSSLNPTMHLVLSATAKDQDAIEIGKRFASVGFDDIIFTALDESLQHGVLINFQNFIGKPFHSFGIGPRIPEDFEPATVERVIDLLLGSSLDIPSIAEALLR